VSVGGKAGHSNERIAVAMSGGVDSSVAALLLHREGRDLVGLSLQLHDRSESGAGDFGRCCSPRDFLDARRVADRVGFPFYVLNMEEEFRKSVLDDFVSEYLSGRTPLPCAHCNSEVKFGDLMRRARALGCRRVATGHYARRQRDPETGTVRLMRARDREKDQSYFLFGLTALQLEDALFPVGDLTKEEVRELAEEAGLHVARKPESMDICFLSREGYRGFLESRLGNLHPRGGDFVDPEGRVLGRHAGIHRFTVGQRRGLGLAGERAWYVLEIRPDSRQVVLGREEEQYRSVCTVRGPNWIGGEAPRKEFQATVQLRHRHPGAEAVVEARGDGTVRLEFLKPQRAITPGQAAVFYCGEEVLGGGFIASAN
jgi:tRNA-uridine 2-sulfurtransferase